MDFNNTSENNIYGETHQEGTGSNPVTVENIGTTVQQSQVDSSVAENAQPQVNPIPQETTQPQADPVLQTNFTTQVSQEMVQPVSQETVQPQVQPVSQAPVQPQVNPEAQASVQPQVQPVSQAPVQPQVNSVSQESATDSYTGAQTTVPTSVEMTETSQNGKKKTKEKKEKKGGHFFLKLLTAALVGIIFGGCAAGSWFLINKYMPDEAVAIEEKVEEFDKDAYKKEIEKDILSKLKDNEDASIVKSVTTVTDTTMQVTDVSDVVEDVMPSVVSITNNFTSVYNYWGRRYEEESEASGSGIIIGENDKELLIATNNHVIEGADVLHVQFIDGESIEANVKGADADNDIAVIAVKLDSMKVSTKDAIEIASLGDSSELRVGEPAIAIGNALGYGQSVTTGVISALDRTLEMENGEEVEGFIQTDAAINPGNSGGALLNVKGEVVGINSSKIGGASVEGMGYAIPISRALPIIDDLKTKKTKSAINEENRGYLGISGRAVSDEMVEVYEFPQGVFVYEVFENSGAEKAGLRKGDIIIKLEGSTIKSMEALQENLAYYEAGETVELTVSRMMDDGTYEDITMQVELISIDDMPAE